MDKIRMIFIICLVFLDTGLGAQGCYLQGQGLLGDEDGGDGIDSNSDADIDADADSDTDADSDADSDGDLDSDTGDSQDTDDPIDTESDGSCIQYEICTESIVSFGLEPLSECIVEITDEDIDYIDAHCNCAFCKQTEQEPICQDNLLKYNPECADEDHVGWCWQDKRTGRIRLCDATCEAVPEGGCPVLDFIFTHEPIIID